MSRVVPRTSIVDELRPGHVIWRPLRTFNGIMFPELADVEVTPQEGKSSFLRTLVDGYGQGIPEPTINPYKGNGKRYGIITFLRANVPDCWTHLVVTATGRGGNCISVIPECIPDVNGYITWRRQIETLYADRAIKSNAELATAVKSYPCPSLRADRTRLQVFTMQDDGYEIY